MAPYWKYPQSLHQCVSMEIALVKERRSDTLPASLAIQTRGRWLSSPVRLLVKSVTPVLARTFDVGHQNDLACSWLSRKSRLAACSQRFHGPSNPDTANSDPNSQAQPKNSVSAALRKFLFLLVIALPMSFLDPPFLIVASDLAPPVLTMVSSRTQTVALI
jgi:hypothetical protein